MSLGAQRKSEYNPRPLTSSWGTRPKVLLPASTTTQNKRRLAMRWVWWAGGWNQRWNQIALWT